jgi:hypothetical protein
MSYPWIKLHTHTIDDPRIGALNNAAWRRYHELLLLAGECDAGGRLIYDGRPMTAAELAWRLHISERRMLANLRMLEACDLARQDSAGCYWLPAFQPTQARPEANERERWRLQKQRQRRSPAADMSADSGADSAPVQPPDIEQDSDETIKMDNEGGVEEDHNPPTAPPKAQSDRPTLPPQPRTPPVEPRPPVSRFKTLNASTPKLATPPADPLEIYRLVCGCAPPPGRRSEILAAVSEPGRWRDALEHWLAHGWNPTNLAGQLDLYRRGGPSGCKSCRPIDGLILELAEKKSADSKNKAHITRTPADERG